MAEYERIWLEPAGAPDRCWCQDNQWGDEGVEYVLASTLESLQRENTALKIDASNHAADAEMVRRERDAADARESKLRKALADIVEDLEMRSKNGVVDCSHGIYCSARTAIASTGGEHNGN